jgi:hypothetical protein
MKTAASAKHTNPIASVAQPAQAAMRGLTNAILQRCA